MHAPVPVRRERRLRLLARPKSAEQAARSVIREQARMQRVAWKDNRWRDGVTVTLGGREGDFMADALALGFSPLSWSPATLDQAKWGWIAVQAGRMTIDQFRQRVRYHAALDAISAP